MHRKNAIKELQKITISPFTFTKKSKATIGKTDKKKFKSESNPHDLIRCIQKDKYVWYSTYDEDMSNKKFTEVLNHCSDKSSPIVIFLNTIRKLKE